MIPFRKHTLFLNERWNYFTQTAQCNHDLTQEIEKNLINFEYILYVSYMNYYVRLIIHACQIFGKRKDWKTRSCSCIDEICEGVLVTL